MLKQLFSSISLFALGSMVLVATGCGDDETVQPDEGQAAPLTFDVFLSNEETFHVTSTLIMGEHDAILVDGQFTLSSGSELADWVAEHDRNLTAVYVFSGAEEH